jgi:hypothetical protein
MRPDTFLVGGELFESERLLFPEKGEHTPEILKSSTMNVTCTWRFLSPSSRLKKPADLLSFALP